MMQRNPATSVRYLALAIALAAGLSVCPGARAADQSAERADLATIIRELTLLDRLAMDGKTVAPRDDRYHFDYTRLASDIARIRSGINDYLSPPRAQPRDPVVLGGEYRREADRP